jgi:hypothetical protein
MTPRTGDGDDRPETGERPWLLVGAPVLWACHFLACYITATIWCVKVAPPGGSLGGARGLIAAYTAAALAGIALVGRGGYRRHRYGTETATHDFDTPGDRHRFLGFATLLLAGLSAVGTLYVAAGAVFIGDCR